MNVRQYIRRRTSRLGDDRQRLPIEINRILLNSVAARSADRYQSAALLAADLQSVAALLEERRSASERLL